MQMNATSAQISHTCLWSTVSSDRRSLSAGVDGWNGCMFSSFISASCVPAHSWIWRCSVWRCHGCLLLYCQWDRMQMSLLYLEPELTERKGQKYAFKRKRVEESLTRVYSNTCSTPGDKQASGHLEVRERGTRTSLRRQRPCRCRTSWSWPLTGCKRQERYERISTKAARLDHQRHASKPTLQSSSRTGPFSHGGQPQVITTVLIIMGFFR